MLGLILTTQVVSYPMFIKVEKDFPTYHNYYVNRISLIVVPVMIIEITLSIVLLFQIKSYLTIIVFLLMLLISLCTFFIQVPIHDKLKYNFDILLSKKLIRTNWIRVFFWFLKCIVSFMLINTIFI